MSYLNSVLQPGEILRFHTRLHWLIYGRAIIVLIIALACALVWWIYAPDNPILPWVALFFAVVGIILFIPEWIRRMSTEIAVTDRRVIFKHGLFQRHTIEINMEKIESVDVDQSILGRLFNYGMVTVRGTGEGFEPLRNIASPIALRNAVMVHPAIGSVTR